MSRYVLKYCRIQGSLRLQRVESMNNFATHFPKRSFTVCRIALGAVETNKHVLRHLKIGVLGAPVDRGQTKSGVAEGPKICRESGFIDTLRDKVGQDIKDYGDVRIVHTEPLETVPSSTNGLKNLKDVASGNKAISDAVKQVVQDDRVCLTLGGDHSIGVGSIDGVSQVHNDLAVLWVDAHCDLNTPATSYSGNIHGMSLSFLLKELQEYVERLPEFSWVQPKISVKNLAYIGLRDVDMHERLILDHFGITAYSMKDVDLVGIRQVTKMALERICPGSSRPLHVSFDIDALDASEVSTTGTPVPGGLTLREGIALLEEVYSCGNMVSMDLVEVNPVLGSQNEVEKTKQVIKHLLINAFGYHRGGIPHPSAQIPRRRMP